MQINKDEIFNKSRRGFFKKALAFVSLLFLRPKNLFSFNTPRKPFSLKGKVAKVTNRAYSPNAAHGARSNAAASMIDGALLKLTGEKSRQSAWAKVASRGETVSIKLNCLAAPNMSPTPELVNAIVDGLKSAGVRENDIVIWERSNRELLRAGFTINMSGSGVRCYGTDALKVPFHSAIEKSGSIGSLFSNILVKCDALINVGVLKDHDLSGVCAGLKNFYGVIHNPNKYHDNNCDPYLADLCNHRFIKGKLRLTVIDALRCQYHGGPAYNSGAVTEYNSILAGFDPVAIDRVAYDILDRERIRHGLKSLKDDNRYPAFIDTAGKLSLGEHRLENINLI